MPVAGAGSRHDAAEARCFHRGRPADAVGTSQRAAATTLLWEANQNQSYTQHDSEGVMERLENPRTQTENYRMVVMLMWRANMEDNT